MKLFDLYQLAVNPQIIAGGNHYFFTLKGGDYSMGPICQGGGYFKTFPGWKLWAFYSRRNLILRWSGAARSLFSLSQVFI